MHVNSTDVLLAVIGGLVLLSYWLPQFFKDRQPAASALIMSSGALAFAFIPNMPPAVDPLNSPEFFEVASEFAVITALFGAGLRIDSRPTLRGLVPTLRLLVIAMPLTIIAVAFVGVEVAGLSLAAAILLGAALSPTDPVLAGDLEVGPPQQGHEHPVRLVLTTEAGFNDGLAFPFVYLGLLVAAQGFSPQGWGVQWLAFDVLYRLAAALVCGAVLGWVIGRMIFRIPRDNRLADRGVGVLAIAAILFCYGITQLLSGYGFIAAFVAALMLRRVEPDHAFQRKLHDFSEAAEHILAALLLFLLGGALPTLFQYATWQLAAIGVLLIFVIRPLIGWVSLIGTPVVGRQRMTIAFYGVRGIGSIYYVAFAVNHWHSPEGLQLWVAMALCILLSTIVHGFTAGQVNQRLVALEDRHQRRIAQRRTAEDEAAAR